MSTHIKDDAKFAKTVLMPGDPLRAKYIAENFFKDYVEVTNVRGILGYTGHTFDGKEVSVMASGMGNPSIGIYSYELYSFYGVETIIRVGSAGSYQKDVHIRDLVIATSASSNSAYANQFELNGAHLAPCSTFLLAKKAYENAIAFGMNNVHVGPVYSSDIFYEQGKDTYKKWRDLGILCVEMESYGLFINAMRLHKKALSILTISDGFEHEGEPEMTKEEREKDMGKMVKLALSLVE